MVSKQTNASSQNPILCIMKRNVTPSLSNWYKERPRTPQIQHQMRNQLKTKLNQKKKKKRKMKALENSSLLHHSKDKAQFQKLTTGGT
jgi:hypothetical protein